MSIMRRYTDFVNLRRSLLDTYPVSGSATLGKDMTELCRTCQGLYLDYRAKRTCVSHPASLLPESSCEREYKT